MDRDWATCTRSRIRRDSDSQPLWILHLDRQLRHNEGGHYGLCLEDRELTVWGPHLSPTLLCLWRGKLQFCGKKNRHTQFLLFHLDFFSGYTTATWGVSMWRIQLRSCKLFIVGQGRWQTFQAQPCLCNIGLKSYATEIMRRNVSTHIAGVCQFPDVSIYYVFFFLHLWNKEQNRGLYRTELTQQK